VVDWDRQEMAVTARKTGRTREEKRRSMRSHRTSRDYDAATEMIETSTVYLTRSRLCPRDLSVQAILENEDR
jgi:hypothetical protein